MIKKDAKSSNVFMEAGAGELYQRRLMREKDLYSGRGLMSMEIFSDEDEACILGISSLLSQLEGQFIIAHPRYPVRLKIQKKLGARLVFLLTMGDYAQRLCESVEGYVKEGARVLTLGAGIGLVSMLAFQKSKQTVMAVEADPTLLQVLETNALLNDAELDIRMGCVVTGQDDGMTDYYISSDLWSSSIYVERGEDLGAEHVQVPVLNVDTLIKEHKADVLLVDIQGAELGLFEQKELKGIETLILTIHTELIGENATARVISNLLSKGFELKDMMGWVFVFKRRSGE